MKKSVFLIVFMAFFALTSMAEGLTYLSTADFKKKAKIFFDNKKIKNTVKRLDNGDLRLTLQGNKKFIVERKRYDDFASSYITNHLQDQAIRMNENYEYYCCIIHGSMQDIYRAANYNPALKRISQSAIEKMHNRMELIYKLPCFFVENEVQYFNKVMALANTIVKSDKANVVKTKMTLKNEPDVNMLMIGDKIGEKTAKKLLSEFESPQAVFDASREDLLSVDGVGESTVAEIKYLKEVYEHGKKV